MSDTAILGLRVKQAEDALSLLRKEWHAAMISESKWKVGDFIKVTVMRRKQQCVEYGRVRSVGIRYGGLHVEFAPQTKTGFHARNEIHIWHLDTVEKVNSVPPLEAK